MSNLPDHVTSQVLGRRELATLNRFGDIMFPHCDEFPAFSETGCIQHIDHIVLHAPEDDIRELATFLKLISFCPGFVLRIIVAMTQRADRFPEPLASFLRLLDMGLRSILVTLYYSGLPGDHYTGRTPLDLIGYHLNIVLPQTLAPEATPDPGTPSHTDR